MYNEMTYFNGVAEKVEDLIPLIDKWGGPETFPHMAAGWAVAFDTPFSWTKQVASDFGGTRNGMVVHWPKGIKEKGGLRSQFWHVIDVAPTILEAAGLPEPKSVNGTLQTPIEGTSLVYTFDDAKAAERHTTQYFEIFGNRAHLSRRLVRAHHPPRAMADERLAAADHGRLGSLQREGGFQSHEEPRRQTSREAEGDAGAVHDGGGEVPRAADRRPHHRAHEPALAGRPDLLGDRTSLTLYEGMKGMMENTFMNVKNRSARSPRRSRFRPAAPTA